MTARYLFDEDAAGMLRYTEHHRPGPLALVVLVLLPAVAPLVLWARSGGVAAVVIAYLAGFLMLALLYLSGWMNRTKVYDRAVVLDTTWPGGSPYVIPLETVDVDRIRYHRRANFIGRRLGQGGRHIRMGPYASRAVTFDGLSPRLALRNGRDVTEARAQVVRPGSRSLPVEDGLVLELQTWAVATGTPEPLLRALEAALVDSGRPEAAGLAARLLADPVVERWREPLTEQEIYGDPA